MLVRMASSISKYRLALSRLVAPSKDCFQLMYPSLSLQHASHAERHDLGSGQSGRKHDEWLLCDAVAVLAAICSDRLTHRLCWYWQVPRQHRPDRVALQQPAVSRSKRRPDGCWFTHVLRIRWGRQLAAHDPRFALCRPGKAAGVLTANIRSTERIRCAAAATTTALQRQWPVVRLKVQHETLALWLSAATVTPAAATVVEVRRTEVSRRT